MAELIGGGDRLGDDTGRFVPFRIDTQMDGRVLVRLHVRGHHLFEITFGCRTKEMFEQSVVDLRWRTDVVVKIERDRFFVVQMEEITQFLGQNAFLITLGQSARRDFHAKGRRQILTCAFEKSNDQIHVLSRCHFFFVFGIQHQSKLNALKVRAEGCSSL